VTAPTQTSTPRRPGGITFIVALAIISSVVHIAGGIWVIIDNDDHRLLRESGLSEDQLAAAGAIAIILGVIGLMLALALSSGSRIARFVFGIWAVLAFAGGLYELVALDGEQRASGAFSAAIGLVLLYLLYGSEKDREYFLHRTD
jgi:hypothetical protein